MLDPQNLGSISIESEFVDLARKANDDCWIQLPLCKLRKLYTTPEEQAFLKNNILGTQVGENHPQDPNGLSEEMKLYWVFQEKRDATTQRNDVSRSIKVSNPVPRNAAARGALAETVTSVAATFESGKGKVGNVSGKGGTPSQSEASKGGGKKGGKGAPKRKKAIISFVYLEFEPFSPQCLSTQRRLFRPSLMDA